MSLSYDLMTAYDLCRELELVCEKNGIEYASKCFENINKKTWVQTLIDDKNVFLKFLASTPSERERKVAWKEDKLQLLLPIGALVYARRAVAYLEIAREMEQIQGLSARKTVAQIADIPLKREHIPLSPWPFDKYNPFQK